jgi:hypothetical protein
MGALTRRALPPRFRAMSRNDDEHLFSSPANAERLLRAFEDSRAGRNMVRMTMEEMEAWFEARLADVAHRRV